MHGGGGGGGGGRRGGAKISMWYSRWHDRARSAAVVGHLRRM